MGNREDTDDAGQLLGELATYFREHPVTGPEGRSYTASGSRATVVAPGLPFNARVVDHITASVAEVEAHTRAADPDAGPLPRHVEDIYRWCREHTEHAPDIVRQRAETIEVRQGLEHAIAAGNLKVIPPHRCPECRCFALRWSREMGRALCTNTECVDADGMSNTFTLARLAYERVAERKNIRHARAT